MWESIASFHHVSPRVSLDSKNLYPVSHLTGPKKVLCFIHKSIHPSVHKVKWIVYNWVIIQDTDLENESYFLGRLLYKITRVLKSITIFLK